MLEVRLTQILKSENVPKLIILRINQNSKGETYSKFEKCALFKFKKYHKWTIGGLLKAKIKRQKLQSKLFRYANTKMGKIEKFNKQKIGKFNKKWKFGK